jgi:hypothetical protein
VTKPPAQFADAHAAEAQQRTTVEDVAKGLGRDGVSTLRNELSGAAADLAAELRGAADRIEWPEDKRYPG